MKQLIKRISYKTIATLLLTIFIQALVWAQDSSVATSATTTTNTTTTTETSTWYLQPWAWVVGGAIFILLIIALVRGNSSKGSSSTDKVTYTKTTERDV